MSYGKTFDSLYTGSMVGAGLHVFGVWNYVIANSKPPGVVELNPRLMAAIFGCEVSLVVEAIRILCEPDPDSRSKECEGRRLLHEGQFLYSIPTWPKYNQMRNEEERRAQNREHARAYRQRKASSASASDASDPQPDASVEKVSVSERQGVLSTSTSTSDASFCSGEGERERETPKVTKAERIEHSPDFVAFWNAYDRKVAKPLAAKAWLKINPDAALASEIIKAAEAYAKAQPDPEFRKHPATWLNARCWEDAPTPKKATTGTRVGGFDRFGKWQGVGDNQNYSEPVTEDNDPFCEHPANIIKRENSQRATKGLPPLTDSEQRKILNGAI